MTTFIVVAIGTGIVIGGETDSNLIFISKLNLLDTKEVADVNELCFVSYKILPFFPNKYN